MRMFLMALTIHFDVYLSTKRKVKRVANAKVQEFDAPKDRTLSYGCRTTPLNVGMTATPLYFIKHNKRQAHSTSMLMAFAFSSIFLISYILNHALHGDTIFPGH